MKHRLIKKLEWKKLFILFRKSFKGCLCSFCKASRPPNPALSTCQRKLEQFPKTTKQILHRHLYSKLIYIKACELVLLERQPTRKRGAKK